MLKDILLGILLMGIAALVYYYLPQGKQIVQNAAQSLNMNSQNVLNQLQTLGNALLKRLIDWINPKPPQPPAPPTPPTAA